MSLEKVLYRAHAHDTGSRDGRAVVPAGNLDFKLTIPREFGGASGEGANPEQLFAAGRTAWFLGAMKFMAARDKIAIPAEVSIDGGVCFEVGLKISLPGMAHEAAQALVDKAHVVCPYSNTTRGDIGVIHRIV